MDIEKQLRKAARESGLSVRTIALRAGLGYASAHRFYNGAGLTLTSAARLATLLDLELKPTGRTKRNKTKGR